MGNEHAPFSAIQVELQAESVHVKCVQFIITLFDVFILLLPYKLPV
jgi:hypothetical protein